MRRILSLAAVATVLVACTTTPSSGPMSFFVTSVGTGKGADFGGLGGADAHCAKLASAAGSSGMNWRAYLSTQARDGVPIANARDRIGAGPWFNAKGVMVAANVDMLHGKGNNITKQTALSEKGELINGRGDTPNKHDILTGTKPDGTAYSPNDGDLTCGNWTRSGADGATVVGHHDRAGPTSDPWATAWNSSHQTRGGCSQDALKGTGGDGLLYCFAAK